jgi:hypothetical protein
VKGSTLISGEREKANAVKVSRSCPHVLLVKAGWKQGRALGSEVDTVYRDAVCEYNVEKSFPDLFGYGTFF